ncbi:hypothetical protein, partial [Streptomyces sp. P17]|uniref:hypothetical protein n=1 Tax=Streptomyces sp. P17 TaxID=3074716 RepID=UPI0028F4607E
MLLLNTMEKSDGLMDLMAHVLDAMPLSMSLASVDTAVATGFGTTKRINTARQPMKSRPHIKVGLPEVGQLCL